MTGREKHEKMAVMGEWRHTCSFSQHVVLLSMGESVVYLLQGPYICALVANKDAAGQLQVVFQSM